MAYRHRIEVGKNIEVSKTEQHNKYPYILICCVNVFTYPVANASVLNRDKWKVWKRK